MKRTVFLAAWIALVVALCAGAGAQQPQPAAPQQPQQPAATAPRLPASPRGLSATQVAGKWAEPTKPGAAPQYAGGKWITVDYGRPILRGRTNIFGAGADYGKAVNDDGPVWRAGANQTTRLKTEVPLKFEGGKTLPAGEYSLFVDLKPDAWTLIVSSQPFQQKYDPNNKTDTWGAYNYDPKHDVLRVPMKTSKITESIDQFTIEFVNMTAQGGTLMMAWERDAASVAFTVAQ
jgi:hypothetical protein